MSMTEQERTIADKFINSHKDWRDVAVHYLNRRETDELQRILHQLDEIPNRVECPPVHFAYAHLIESEIGDRSDCLLESV